mmetsp:Transcript_65447/g.147658  ORF Transcript_65447/g.147658 Transcript_65447/m.147658 type:complete len:231 (-) Transcript_65447:492-1184(-)
MGGGVLVTSKRSYQGRSVPPGGGFGCFYGSQRTASLASEACLATSVSSPVSKFPSAGSTRGSSRIFSRTSGCTTTLAITFSTPSLMPRIFSLGARSDCSKSAMIGSAPSAGTIACLPSSVVVIATSAPAAAFRTAQSLSPRRPQRMATASFRMASSLAVSVKHRNAKVVAASRRTSTWLALRSLMQPTTPPAPRTSSSPDWSLMQLYMSLSTRGFTPATSMPALRTRFVE